MVSGDALISIKPWYAEAILSGEKTVELRRRIPKYAIGCRLWIYATLPIGAVVGSAVVERIETASPDAIWRDYSEAMALNRVEFDSYLEGSSAAIALKLAKVVKRRHTNINQLRSLRAGFHPPQVLSRLSNQEMVKLSEMAIAL